MNGDGRRMKRRNGMNCDETKRQNKMDYDCDGLH